MNSNSIGTLLKLTTFGESHGKATGFILEGLPSNLTIDFDFIKKMLDKRKGNNLTKNRKETDNIIVLSGYDNNKTIGSPLTIIFENNNARPIDYTPEKYRPSHGDLTYFERYNVQPLSGGGRLSGRETTARVAAGSIAIQVLKQKYNINIEACVTSIGDIKNNFGDDITNDQKNYLKKLEKEKDSTGALVEIRINNVPAGLGDPIFEKVDALIAQSLMSIGSVKAVSIGDGFDCYKKKGSQRNDQITNKGYCSNNDGGIVGGITNGEEIRLQVCSKPTPSIGKELKTIDINRNNTTTSTIGRHDVCIGLRLPAVLEASCALILLDRILIKKAYSER